MIAETLFVVGMVVAAASDVRSRRIPNVLTMSMLVAGLVARGWSGGPTEMVWGLAGAATGLTSLLVPFGARWLGGGDVKLAAAAGAWLGPRGALLTALFGLVGGGIHGLVITARGGRALRSEVAGNLRWAMFALRAPAVPRRRRSELVPLAVSIATAAVGVLLYFGGLDGTFAP